VRGVRWEAGRRKGKGRMVGVRCEAAVTEKPAGEEEAAGEQFEYQAEVGLTSPRLGRMLDLASSAKCQC
jgi:hypothetical protein